jgi:tetratricopeptide (TPR) repeat protein
VIGTIARLLGLFDGEGDLEERLVAHIEDRQLLLVLDNFEQVVDAAPSVASVVAASPGLKVAVTSRTRLRVRGEQELPLAPLARGDSVSLFLERARAVRPDFEADTTDLETIAEICGHLDDLPLAIELAATRVKVLSPSTMLSRLDHRLELLTSGLRDAPSRHQALRDAIGWSVELLADDDEERVLFRRFSVFVGGSTLDAVEDVCGGELDELGSLVDKSLIRVDGERFGMLETIREYAGKALFREALAVYKGLRDEGGVARALDRLAMCLVVAGEMDRARPLFEQSLGLFRRLGDSHGVALGLYGLAATRPTGALAAARSYADESLDILRAVGDRRAYGKMLWNAADINADLGDVETAAAQFEESLTLFVEFGDRWFGRNSWPRRARMPAPMPPRA